MVSQANFAWLLATWDYKILESDWLSAGVIYFSIDLAYSGTLSALSRLKLS